MSIFGKDMKTSNDGSYSYFVLYCSDSSVR